MGTSFRLLEASFKCHPLLFVYFGNSGTGVCLIYKILCDQRNAIIGCCRFFVIMAGVDVDQCQVFESTLVERFGAQAMFFCIGGIGRGKHVVDNSVECVNTLISGIHKLSSDPRRVNLSAFE